METRNKTTDFKDLTISEEKKKYLDDDRYRSDRFFGRNKDYKGTLKIIPPDSILNATVEDDGHGNAVLVMPSSRK